MNKKLCKRYKNRPEGTYVKPCKYYNRASIKTVQASYWYWIYTYTTYRMDLPLNWNPCVRGRGRGWSQLLRSETKRAARRIGCWGKRWACPYTYNNFTGWADITKCDASGWWGITEKGTRKKMVLESLPESRKSQNRWKMTWEFFPNIWSNRW